MYPTDLVALLCAGLFAVASIYVNLVEHPAPLECGTRLGLDQFAPRRYSPVVEYEFILLGRVYRGDAPPGSA